MGDFKPHHHVLSDLHLGHEKILSYCRPWFSSIKEHDEHILNNISQLRPNDYLWLLGDIAFTKEGLYALKEAAQCHLGLVMGNHDVFPMKMYSEVFNKVRGVGQMNYKDPMGKLLPVLFTHIPMHPDQVARWFINIHVHLHIYHADGPYFNASCEPLEFKPKKIDDILLAKCLEG